MGQRNSGPKASGPLDWFTSIDETLENEVIPNQEALLQALGGLEGLPGSIDRLAEAIAQGDEAFIANGIRNAFAGRMIPLPIEGAAQAFPPATEAKPIAFDITNGVTTVPTVGEFEFRLNTLDNLGVKNAFSGSLYVDSPVSVRLYDDRGDQTADLSTGAAGYIGFSSTRVATVEVDSPVPFLVGGVLSTALQNPFDPRVKQVGIARVGRLASTPNDFSDGAVPFVPTTATTADDFRADSLDDAIDTYGRAILPSDSPMTQVWIVQNAGANDLDVQVVGYNVSGEAMVADTDIHASTDLTEAITVAAGDTVILESSIQTETKLLRTRSTAADTPSEPRMQYTGTVPGMR